MKTAGIKKIKTKYIMEKEIKRESRTVTRKFARENFTEESFRETLRKCEIFTEEQIERELRIIYDSPIESLEGESGEVHLWKDAAKKTVESAKKKIEIPEIPEPMPKEKPEDGPSRDPEYMKLMEEMGDAVLAGDDRKMIEIAKKMEKHEKEKFGTDIASESENNKTIEDGKRKVDDMGANGQGTGDGGVRPAGRKRDEGNGLHRLLLSAEESRNLGSERIKEASNLFKTNVGSNVLSQQKALSAFEQEDVLVNWAKENNILYGKELHEDLKELWDKDEYGRPERIGGMEADVFPIHENQRAIKTTDYFKMSNKPRAFIDNRIILHNEVFSNAAYNLLGIMNYKDSRGNNIFRFVTDQPFIEEMVYPLDMSDSVKEEIMKEEIEKYLTSIGFEKEKYGKNEWKRPYKGRKFLRLSDTHTKNFIRDRFGNMFCIDSVLEVTDY